MKIIATYICGSVQCICFQCLLHSFSLNKLFYGEAPPQGPIPYPFIYDF